MAAAAAVAGAACMGLAPLPWAGLGLPLYLAAVFARPWVAAPTIILALPYHLHPRIVLGLELSLAEVAIIGATAAVLARWALDLVPLSPARRGKSQDWTARGRSHPLTPLRPSVVDLGAAAFLAAAFLSLLVTEYPRQSLRELRWVILEPLLVFYVVRATVRSERLVALTLGSIVASGALAGLIGLANVGADLGERAVGPYLSPNHLGLWLGRTGAVALALALFGRPRAAGASASLLLVAPLARTLSLGAWLGYGAAALVLGYFRGRRWLAAATIALALAAAISLVALPPDRVAARLDPGVGTGLFRVHIWAASVRMVADHPILGIGLDNYLYEYRGGYMLPEAWQEPNISHPHNWVLDFWLSLGLLGLGAALGLMAWTLAASHRLFRLAPTPTDRVLGAAAAAMLADFVVHGFVDNSYFLVDAASLWWAMLGLLVARSRASSPTLAAGGLQSASVASTSGPPRLNE